MSRHRRQTLAATAMNLPGRNRRITSTISGISQKASLSAILKLELARLHSLKARSQSKILPCEFCCSEKMHVNFLHPYFEARVDCDVVTSDGYCASNLISLDFRERSRGFLAAHFIKPPAILLFQLPFPVHVESMVIKPKVGSQISSGIAILVAGIANKHSSTRKRDQRTAPSSLSKKKSKNPSILLADSNKVESGASGLLAEYKLGSLTPPMLMQYSSYSCRCNTFLHCLQKIKLFTDTLRTDFCSPLRKTHQ